MCKGKLVLSETTKESAHVYNAVSILKRFWAGSEWSEHGVGIMKDKMEREIFNLGKPYFK